jgi:hypothetical protein
LKTVLIAPTLFEWNLQYHDKTLSTLEAKLVPLAALVNYRGIGQFCGIGMPCRQLAATSFFWPIINKNGTIAMFG